MPYHIGSKNSGGCSGFPVMTDTGKVVGCHPTKAEATNHLQALYANVPDASKADTPMDVIEAVQLSVETNKKRILKKIQ